MPISLKTREVAFLYGWGMHNGLWGDLPDRLRNHGWSVTLLDLPGHGNARDNMSDMDLRPLAHWISQQIHRDSCLIAWSLGGLVALAMARYHPEHLHRLVLIGSSPCFVCRKDWHTAMPTSQFTQFSTQLKRNPEQAMQGFLGLQTHGSHDARQNLRLIRHHWQSGSIAKTQALISGLQILGDTDFRAELGDIDCATLILHGEQDRLVPLSAAQALQAALPKAHLSPISGAGHAPFLSHPDTFYTALSEFIHA